MVSPLFTAVAVLSRMCRGEDDFTLAGHFAVPWTAARVGADL